MTTSARWVPLGKHALNAIDGFECALVELERHRLQTIRRDDQFGANVALARPRGQLVRSGKDNSSHAVPQILDVVDFGSRDVGNCNGFDRFGFAVGHIADLFLPLGPPCYCHLSFTTISFSTERIGTNPAATAIPLCVLPVSSEATLTERERAGDSTGFPARSRRHAVSLSGGSVATAACWILPCDHRETIAVVA